MESEEIFLNIAKATYHMFMGHIIIKGEIKALNLKAETRWGCPLSPLLFTVLLRVLFLTVK